MSEVLQTLQKWATIRQTTIEELILGYDLAGYRVAWITFRELKTGRLFTHKIERGRVT